jgi:integrase
MSGGSNFGSIVRLCAKAPRRISKTIARQAERTRRRELELGVNRVEKRKKMPLFSLAAREWLDRKRITSAHATAETYRYFIEGLIRHFGERLVSDIDHEDIAALQSRRLREGKSTRTVNLEVSTLRQVLRAHRLWAPISEEVHHLRERHDVGRAIDREDEEKLFDAIRRSRSPALLPLFVLALDTGLRRSELRSLKFRDLALTWREGVILAGTLTVRKSKTDAGTGRIVPLTRRVCSVLSLWTARIAGADPDTFVFPAHKVGLSGNDRIAYAYEFDPSRPAGEWKKAWNDALKRAGLKYRWHDCRHTFITRLCESPAVSEETIRSLAGHVSQKMLERYSHVRVAAKQAAIATLEKSDFVIHGAQNWAQLSDDSALTECPVDGNALN